MDDDSSSSVSFEDIRPRANRFDDGYSRPFEDDVVDRLRALVAKSTADGTQALVAGSHVPDVVYALQYKETFGGRTTESELTSHLQRQRTCRLTKPVASLP